MNYAVVYLVAILLLSMLYWVIRGKKHYTGPPLGAKVNESDPSDRKSNEGFSSKHENPRSALA